MALLFFRLFDLAEELVDLGEHGLPLLPDLSACYHWILEWSL